MDIRVFDDLEQLQPFAEQLLYDFLMTACRGDWRRYSIDAFMDYFYARYWVSGDPTETAYVMTRVGDGDYLRYEKYPARSEINRTQLLIDEGDCYGTINAEHVFYNYRPVDHTPRFVRRTSPYHRITKTYWRTYYKVPIGRKERIEAYVLDEAVAYCDLEQIQIRGRSRLNRVIQELDYLVPRTRRPRRSWKNKSKARKQWAQKGNASNEKA